MTCKHLFAIFDLTSNGGEWRMDPDAGETSLLKQKIPYFQRE
ncbi:hypothetical protein [Enterococcus devriesei]